MNKRCVQLASGLLTLSAVMGSTAGALPGQGLGLLGEMRALEISRNADIDPIRGSLGEYKLATEDGRVTVLDGGGFDVLSDTTTFSQTDAVDAEFYTLQYLAILQKNFGMDGLDDKKTPIILQTAMRSPDLAADPCTGKLSDQDALPLASWSNEKHTAYFSAATPWTGAFASSVTVVTHELTHGVTAATSQLGTVGEAGALNEAFSDMMAMYMSKQISPARFSWVMGAEVQNDLKCSGTRSLSRPGDSFLWVDDASGTSTVKESVREHYSKIYQGTEDAHGAHLNSGIPSHAFYLLSEGGEGVVGIGLENAMQIFFRGFTRYLKPNSTIKDGRDATLRAATERAPDSLASVKAAWAAVGL